MAMIELWRGNDRQRPVERAADVMEPDAGVGHGRPGILAPCSMTRTALTQPTSRGQVRLASADWRDKPLIEPNYLGTDHDLSAVVTAIEAAGELGRQSAFDQMRETEVVPGPKAASRQEII